MSSMMKFRYVLLLALVVYLLTGIYQVGPDERAVVRRFGQVVARPGPGLGFGMPWGIDQVLLTGSSALPAWVMDRLAERLPGLRLGVRVQRASVALLAPPDEVRNAFEAVTQAQTAIRTKETQARQERDQRLSQAGAMK